MIVLLILLVLIAASARWGLGMIVVKMIGGMIHWKEASPEGIWRRVYRYRANIGTRSGSPALASQITRPWYVLEP